MTRKTWINSIRFLAVLAIAVLPGLACSYSVSAQAIPAGGGVFAVSVSTQNGCAWQLTDNTGWISNYSGTTGHGPATALMYAQPNHTGVPRSATLHVVVESTCTLIGGRSSCAPTYIAASTTAMQMAH
jgi:hypothetical protein